MSSQFIFTCKFCGSHELNVVWCEDLISYSKKELSCLENCDNEGALAAIIKHKSIERFKCWGPLDEDHRFAKAESILFDTFEEDEYEDINCEDCYEASEEDDWFDFDDDDDFAGDLNEVNGQIGYYVNCAGCDREIEFGWSHPDRGGRIWPIECEDFNPRKSWPEPRYKESWEKRNWIQPDG